MDILSKLRKDKRQLAKVYEIFILLIPVSILAKMSLTNVPKQERN